MGVKVWVHWDIQYERYYILDWPSFGGAGPIEISNELYERIMENEREDAALQSLMEMLEYEWENPDD